MQSGSTSTPMICHPETQTRQQAAHPHSEAPSERQQPGPAAAPLRLQQYPDLVHFALWGGQGDLLLRLCRLSVHNLQQSGKSAEVLERMLRRAAMGLQYARAVFFLLLNIDIVMKQDVVKGVPSLNMSGLHGARAPGFFQTLQDDVVPAWQRNEFETTETLLCAVKRAYLAS